MNSGWTTFAATALLTDTSLPRRDLAESYAFLNYPLLGIVRVNFHGVLTSVGCTTKNCRQRASRRNDFPSHIKLCPLSGTRDCVLRKLIEIPISVCHHGAGNSNQSQAAVYEAVPHWCPSRPATLLHTIPTTLSDILRGKAIPDIASSGDLVAI